MVTASYVVAFAPTTTAAAATVAAAAANTTLAALTAAKAAAAGSSIHNRPLNGADWRSGTKPALASEGCAAYATSNSRAPLLCAPFPGCAAASAVCRAPVTSRRLPVTSRKLPVTSSRLLQVSSSYFFSLKKSPPPNTEATCRPPSFQLHCSALKTSAKQLLSHCTRCDEIAAPPSARSVD